RTALGSIHDAASKSRTSPPALCSYLLMSKRVSSASQERPSTRLVHAASRSLPTGLTTPRPVTTTRRVSSGLRTGDSLLGTLVRRGGRDPAGRGSADQGRRPPGRRPWRSPSPRG